METWGRVQSVGGPSNGTERVRCEGRPGKGDLVGVTRTPVLGPGSGDTGVVSRPCTNLGFRNKSPSFLRFLPSQRDLPRNRLSLDPLSSDTVEVRIGGHGDTPTELAERLGVKGGFQGFPLLTRSVGRLDSQGFTNGRTVKKTLDPSTGRPGSGVTGAGDGDSGGTGRPVNSLSDSSFVPDEVSSRTPTTDPG